MVDLHGERHFSNPLKINDNEFIVTYKLNDKFIGIFKYNILKNEWIKITEFQGDCSHKNNSKVLCIDESITDTIFVPGKDSNIAKINIKSGALQWEENKNITSTAFIKLFKIGDDIHSITGDDMNSKTLHAKWNAETLEIETIFEFYAAESNSDKPNSDKPNSNTSESHESDSDYSDSDYHDNGEKHFEDFQVIYVKSQNKLILFGGLNSENIYRLDHIWSHELGTKVWNESPQKMHDIKSHFGIVKTMDERYAVLFGGNTGRPGGTRELEIIDLMTLKSVISKIEMPNGEDYHAINFYEFALCGSKEKGELLVSGFIRSSITEIPKEVIEMMIACASEEFVYLLNELNGNVWRINLNDILFPAVNEFEI